MAGSKLKIDIRRSKIMDQLRREGNVSVSRLSDTLGVTTVTIRSDLDAMEKDGLLIRIQGGAVPPVTEREAKANTAVNHCADGKHAIASAIVSMIHDGDTLFINSGTTTAMVANALCCRRNLNIVTNSLQVATILGNCPTMRVILLGGEINSRYGFTYGSNAREQLSRYQADWAILSVDGVSTEGGITTYHAEEAAVDRMMISGAKRVLIAADHSKIGRVGFARVSDEIGEVILVTDKECSTEMLSLMRTSGMQVEIG